VLMKKFFGETMVHRTAGRFVEIMEPVQGSGPGRCNKYSIFASSKIIFCDFRMSSIN